MAGGQKARILQDRITDAKPPIIDLMTCYCGTFIFYSKGIITAQVFSEAFEGQTFVFVEKNTIINYNEQFE